MQLEQTRQVIKERKGSCSTLETSPEAMEDLEHQKVRKSMKHKKVKKATKLKKSTSMETAIGEEECQDPIIDSVKSNQSRIFQMVKQISSLFKFHSDTYLICIKIANALKFDGEANLCNQVAAVICFLVQKVYESFKTDFMEISKWTGFALTRETYIDTEATILAGLNYQLPVLDPSLDEAQIQSQVDRYQSIYEVYQLQL